MRRCALLTALGVAAALPATAAAGTSTAPRESEPGLGLSEARRAARVGAQQFYADLFDSRARVGRCRRLGTEVVVCRVRISGVVRCSFTMIVRKTPDDFILRGRGLRCSRRGRPSLMA